MHNQYRQALGGQVARGNCTPGHPTPLEQLVDAKGTSGAIDRIAPPETGRRPLAQAEPLMTRGLGTA
ncbi:hypothetical protein GCM10018777_08180 [Streptomyces albogriseolus]|nr:hypothetical protein GCM10018777_08180 [Streptomyces viridodiastaticus]